jgi:hypothetical protein
VHATACWRIGSYAPDEHASEQVRTGNHLPWWTLSSFMASGLLKIKTGDHLP